MLGTHTNGQDDKDDDGHESFQRLILHDRYGKRDGWYRVYRPDQRCGPECNGSCTALRLHERRGPECNRDGEQIMNVPDADAECDDGYCDGE